MPVELFRVVSHAHIIILVENKLMQLVNHAILQVWNLINCKALNLLQNKSRRAKGLNGRMNENSH